MVTVLNHPVAKKHLSILRDALTDTAQWRASVRIIANMLAVEATAAIPTGAIRIDTPVECDLEAETFDEATVLLLPVLRAGLSLTEGFTSLLPAALLGYAGYRRDEATLQPSCYLMSLPPADIVEHVYVLEPMIATGGTVCNLLSTLILQGYPRPTVCSLIAAPEGIQYIQEKHPGTNIITAALDSALNDKGFITPGLGDAGDRWSGAV